MTGLPDTLEARLSAAAPRGIDYSQSASRQGSVTVWCGLADSEDIFAVGKALRALGARLAMVSALQLPKPEAEDEEEPAEGEAEAEQKEAAPQTFGGTPIDGSSYEIDYHFALGGDFLTVIAYVPRGGSVPSLTPLFRSANWPEREIMEIYAIVVRDHPDPRRLFLDPAIDGAVLERLIPYSTLVNAASTKELWDKVAAAKGGAQ